MAENLRAVGAEAVVEGDDLHVVGSRRPLRGRVETGGDHRLAMTFAVLGLTTGARVELSEAASAGVSYPGFFEDLLLVTGR
jgi:3-phosphoshikimate 1-carboxyvinyltransferase